MEEESWEGNHASGKQLHLGSIWEASGKHLGGISERPGRHLGATWEHLGDLGPQGVTKVKEEARYEYLEDIGLDLARPWPKGL